jgi:hypothetical protein
MAEFAVNGVDQSNLKPIFAFMGMSNRTEVTANLTKKKQKDTIICTKLYTTVSYIKDIIVPVSLNQIKNSVL